MNAPPPVRAALLVDDSRFDYLDMRSLLLGSQADVERLEWLQEWPGSDVALAKGPFDLFFVDMHLGSLSGLDVVRDLRAAGVRVPVIALTGQANDEIDRACADAGAADFLVKGQFDRTMLERSIRYAERQAVAQRELDRLNAALERRAVAESDQARLMRFAIEQATDGIFISGAGTGSDDHAIIYVNAAMCVLLGRRAGDLLGSATAALFATDAQGDHAVPATDALRDSAATVAGEFLLRAAHGPVGAFVRVTPLRSSAGVVEHFVWSCRALDEAQRNARLDRRRARYETIGQLVAGLAHDINDRVTTVIGNLDLLAPKVSDEAQQRLLRSASRNADRLMSEARLLMSLSNRDVVDDDAHPQAVIVDLEAMLGTLDKLLHQAVGALVQLERTAKETPWPVQADRDELQFAILELALNARDAMPEGGSLKIVCTNLPAGDAARAGLGAVALEAGHDYVALAFTDSGVGMSAEVLAHARDPYFTTKSGRGGTGAGLGHVERAMQLTGGALGLESVPGIGSTATLYLRRAEPH